MDNQLHPLWSVGWNHLSIPKLQRCNRWRLETDKLQYIPRNMHTVTALLCFVVVIHWLIFPYPSGLLHWHCGNLTIAPVPAKQPWWIWINTSCEFIMNDCITTTKQSTTKPCAYFLGYTVFHPTLFWQRNYLSMLELNLTHVSKRGCKRLPRSIIITKKRPYEMTLMSRFLFFSDRI